MKFLTKIALTIALLTSAVACEARSGSGHAHSNGVSAAPHYRSGYGLSSAGASSGFVYRNPYAASPSVRVRGYTRSNGTYVAPHVRTPANNTVTDNLSYRGNGTIRVPR